ncbi:MAG: hypothetical protein KIS92_15345 [Planctomycetota bacterium]|nr:hypothetical protein [Planctomycetota bacterium]
MSRIELFFDENFSKPAIDAFKNFVIVCGQPHLSLHHAFDHLPPGTSDEDLAKYCEGKGFLVISSDRGIKGRIPISHYLESKNITHVILSAGIHQKKQFEKIRLVFSVLPDIEQAYAGPLGQKYSLSLSGGKGSLRPSPEDAARFRGHKSKR